MKDITTFETSVRLKEAGFPQPFPTAGMFGYNDKGHLFVRTHDGSVDNNRYGSVLLNGGNDNISLSKNDFKSVVFAPTAIDILRELPDNAALYRVNMDMFLCWIRKDRAPMIGDGPCMVNAAEAAAEAWIEWKEQTTTI